MASNSYISRLSGFMRWLPRIVGTAAYKFYWDDCFSRAASLAYTTLFALVPVAALSFSMFDAFGITETQVSSTLEKLISEMLPPNENELLTNMHSQVMEYLNSLSESVRALGVVSIGVLIFTGLALLNTIESALNAVWRVSSQMSITAKLFSFWAVITGGPLLVLVALFYYTKVDALAGAHFLPSGAGHLWASLVPPVAIWLALTILFSCLPAAKVGMNEAALGAFFSAVLFELAKRGFAYYISQSTTYSKFYGVLTSIPLILFWIYLIWVVILFGAEISYQAGSIELMRGLRKYATDLGEVGAILGLRVLHLIGSRFISGEAPPSDQEIAIETGSDPVLVRTCLEVLTRAQLIAIADTRTHTRTLVRNPDKIKINDVFTAFHSKRYILRNGGDEAKEHSRELRFLEAVKNLSRRLEQNRSPEDWTLQELILA